MTAASNSSNGPIFVTGAGCSGKTILCMLLASHPRLAISQHETYFWRDSFRRYGDLSRPANFEACLQAVVSHVRTRGFDHDTDAIRDKFRRSDGSYAALFSLLMEDVAERVGKPRWGCHTQGLEDRCDTVLGYYPDARVVHLIRDPRDRCVALGQRRAVVRRVPGQLGAETAIWLHSVTRAEDNRRRYEDRYCILHYESLVSEPERTLEGVVRFLGEDSFTTSVMLEGLEKVRNKRGRIAYGRLTVRGVGCYRTQLSRRATAFIQMRAARAMLAQGYEPERLELSIAERARLYAFDVPLNLGRAVLTDLRDTLARRAG